VINGIAYVFIFLFFKKNTVLKTLVVKTKRPTFAVVLAICRERSSNYYKDIQPQLTT